MEKTIRSLEEFGAYDVTNPDYKGEGRMFRLYDKSDETDLLIKVFADGEIEVSDGRSEKHIYRRKGKPTHGLMLLLSDIRGNLNRHYDTLDK